MRIIHLATAAALLIGGFGAGCAGAQERQGMTRADVTGGGCAAVIWMPPLHQEHTQVVLETLLQGSLKIESALRTSVGEASDTGDAYLCFTAVPGREAAVVEAITLLIETDLRDAGLEVLGPFFRD
ncbi:MAG: hypothetical protein ACK42I_10585 [Thermomicrobium sp.]